MDSEKQTVNTDNDDTNAHFWSKWCHQGCSVWCKKYFWEGQLQRGSTDNRGKSEVVSTLPSDHQKTIKITPTQRKLLAFLVPAIVVHFCWWAFMIKQNNWYLFQDKYPMTITMLFASAIGGMTSKGGGAVAFPVMTLVMNVTPGIARDFAVMIQSFGMGSASVGIMLMKVHIEIYALLCCFIGGVFGVILGIELLDKYITPDMKKMGFVSIWFAFTFALFLLNRQRKRKTFHNIPNLNWWRMLILIFSGVIGGVITAFCGSGIDICCFGLLTLFFRVSEKVATPTSIILMALISMVGFFWRGLIIEQITTDAWEFLLVCIPVAVIGAPLGSVIGSHFHRLVLASLVHVIDTTALIAAFAIIHQTPLIAGFSVGIIIIGALIFFIITKVGEYLMKQQEKNYEKNLEKLKEDVESPQIDNNCYIINIGAHIKNGQNTYSDLESTIPSKLSYLNYDTSMEDCNNNTNTNQEISDTTSDTTSNASNDTAEQQSNSSTHL